MWSSWVKENGTTHVMYITKLKDGPKRVKKTLSMILERVFEMVWWRGRKWNHIKKEFWSWSIFLLSPLLFEENLGDFLFSFFFFMLRLLRTWGFWWYLRRKSLLQKLLFKWLQYIGSGRIFWNRVMHANMAKPWLWRWGSCGYIDGGRIFRSGGMHANIFGWGYQKNLVANHFRKNSKHKWTHLLTNLNTNKSCYVDNIWL
jgi:hypothetical protein